MSLGFRVMDLRKVEDCRVLRFTTGGFCNDGRVLGVFFLFAAVWWYFQVCFAMTERLTFACNARVGGCRS